VIVWIFLILFTACLPLFLTFKLSNGWNSSIPTSTPMPTITITPTNTPTMDKISLITPSATSTFLPATSIPTNTPTPIIVNTSTPTAMPIKIIATATPQLPTVYVIKNGDNLWKISDNFYGSGIYNIFICDINDLADNCSLIHSGNSLLIPSR